MDQSPALQAQRDQLSSHPKAEDRLAKIRKFFMPEDAIAAAKALDARVHIGHGAEMREVVVMPLSPLGFVEAYELLRTTLMPVVGLYRPGEKPPEITEVANALGDKIVDLPKLLHAILKRGNPNLSVDWMNEHMDLSFDLQLILPHFLEQNGLVHLFGGNDTAPATAQPVAQNGSAELPTTAA